MIKFNLDEIIEDIANKLNTTYRRASQLSYNIEYLLPFVQKEDLLDLGFKFKGMSTSTKMPLYEYENLIAIFDDQILHIC